jgi:BlaI family penicillinase repressor
VPPTTDATDAELAVLKLLWSRDGATIRELADELYPGGETAHYATVQKLLDRLESKALVERRRVRRSNVYSCRVDRGELIGRRLRDTAEKLCDGSLTPLLTHLVNVSDLSAADLADLRNLVRRLDGASRVESGDR